MSNRERESLKSFENKICKIVYRDGQETHAVLGLVVSFNPSFLIEKSSKGRLFFFNTELILKIEEVVQDDTEKSSSPKVTKP